VKIKLSNLASPHDPIVASAAPSSVSRLRFLIGGATIAVAIYVPAAATGAAFKQANSSTPSTEIKGHPTMSSMNSAALMWRV
jgi:hypothetical protein